MIRERFLYNTIKILVILDYYLGLDISAEIVSKHSIYRTKNVFSHFTPVSMLQEALVKTLNRIQKPKRLPKPHNFVRL